MWLSKQAYSNPSLRNMFRITKEFEPSGDQPQAIDKLSKGIQEGKRSQVLLGVTGSGKTFTMAHIIEKVQKPTIILAHNKTLAGQLYQEFKTLFPNNAVEYFVSYYDYYQPEAYVARTDTYIEKDLAINDRIDKMRLSATRALLERQDVIIISSVSCIYGLGMPEWYSKMKLTLKVGETYRRDDVLLHMIELQYKRNDYDLARTTFRVRGDVLEIVPSYEEDLGYRIEFFGDEIDRISEIDPLTGKVKARVDSFTLYPATHHVTPEDVRLGALDKIRDELKERVSFFEKEQRWAERDRIRQRTNYDMEMIKEIGYCKGVENYSRHLSGRSEGQAPSCLLDYFPDDYLLFVDESHQTLPQVRAMYNGDRARKQSLVEFGFRLPSAYDNRPLKFEEFYLHINQVVYVSATPSPWEIEESGGEVTQQIIRPTGLLDPVIEVRPASNQVDDCLEEIRIETGKNRRVLVTTLTKRLSEDLTSYLKEIGIRTKYLHSDIDTIERMQIIQDLRQGKFDVLVGINLLREGLDIPEVSLVAILDADKEGFLRSETALTQTCGRAARNVNGRVIMYADTITKSIQATLDVTKKRRILQEAYNQEHNITPRTVSKSIDESFAEPKPDRPELTQSELELRIKQYEKQMKQAAKEFKFEEAAKYRDLLRYHQSLELDS